MNRIVLTAVLVLSSGFAALAQQPTGRILGQVAIMDDICGARNVRIMRVCKSTDKTAVSIDGLPMCKMCAVAGATVVAREIKTNQLRAAITGNDGSYRFDQLPVGNYDISADKPGFKTAVQPTLTLIDGATAVGNFTLEVSEMTQMSKILHTVPNTLRMLLSLDPQQDAKSRDLALRLELRNVGSSEISVMLNPPDCGGHPYISTILFVLADTHGKSATLENIKGRDADAMCGSNFVDYVIPLRAGATFFIPINLDDYSSSGIWHPGETYSLQAELTVNGSQSSGVLATSNQLQIHFPDK